MPDNRVNKRARDSASNIVEDPSDKTLNETLNDATTKTTRNESRAKRRKEEKQDDVEEASASSERGSDAKPREKANFGLSGALMSDVDTGSTRNGVVLKWSAPADARTPTSKWRLYVFKREELIDTLHISKQSSYIIGRENRVADIPVFHPSISKQHAVIQFRLVEAESSKQSANGRVRRIVRPYLMDLESTNGTTINKRRIPTSRYVELKEKDVINFGHSTRDYVLLHDKSR